MWESSTVREEPAANGPRGAGAERRGEAAEALSDTAGGGEAGRHSNPPLRLAGAPSGHVRLPEEAKVASTSASWRYLAIAQRDP